MGEGWRAAEQAEGRSVGCLEVFGGSCKLKSKVFKIGKTVGSARGREIRKAQRNGVENHGEMCVTGRKPRRGAGVKLIQCTAGAVAEGCAGSGSGWEAAGSEFVVQDGLRGWVDWRII